MEEYFPSRQKHALRRLSDALIRRLLDNAKALEMNPHWVSRIRQTPVRVDVCRQKVREFIVNDRFRNRQDGEQCGPERQSKQANRNHRKRAVAGKRAEPPLEFLEPARPE